MKYWIKYGCKGKGITLDDGDNYRILSISKALNSDEIMFVEECDQWFEKAYTKEQAIEALQEAIDYIKENL